MPTIELLCRALNGKLEGPGEVEISGVGSLEKAGPTDLAAVDSEGYVALAEASQAGGLLVKTGLAVATAQPRISVDFPLAALNRVIEILGLVRPLPRPGVHAAAIVDPDAILGDGCHVGPGAVVAGGARIGARTVLLANVVVEPDVVIGDDCLVAPGAVIHDGARIGNRVRIGANAVVSRQGFGYAPGPDGPVRLHHVGQVVIGDGAEIGAGTMVDRARYDTTHIGTQTKLDNLVHIAHNCSVGDRTFIAAQTGLAGRARIGSDCEIGGQVGFANQGVVGDRCRVGAQGGVIGRHGDGVDLWGTPAESKRTYLKRLARLRKLAKEDDD